MGLDLTAPPGDTQLLAQNCGLQRPPNVATARQASWGAGRQQLPHGPQLPSPEGLDPQQSPQLGRLGSLLPTVSGTPGGCLKPLDQGAWLRCRTRPLNTEVPVGLARLLVTREHRASASQEGGFR